MWRESIMKTIFAEAKSQYSHALINFINFKLTPTVRYENYRRMQEIEEYVKEEGDEIQIVITTKNTPRPGQTAPAMEPED